MLRHEGGIRSYPVTRRSRTARVAEVSDDTVAIICSHAKGQLSLFTKMGYETDLFRASNDGGACPLRARSGFGWFLGAGLLGVGE
jgi:hypothetical protein